MLPNDVDHTFDPESAQAMHSADEVETSEFSLITHNPDNLSLGQTTIFPENSTRGDIINHLAKQVPANEFGLPLFYYRSDFIPIDKAQTLGYLSEEDYQVATQYIYYTEGYPTLDDGTPFWQQLPHEPYPSYVLFKLYLEQAELEGIRVLADLATEQQMELQAIRSNALEYYWTARSRAYDMFIIARNAKIREHRINKAENKHFETAGNLLEQLLVKFDNPEWIKDLSASEALENLERLVRIQRLSLGLTGQQSSTNVGAPAQGSSVEVIMRSLTKNIGLSSGAQEGFADRLQRILTDESTAMGAQELIVKMSRG